MAGPIRISILANGRQARSEAQATAAAYSGLGRTLTKIGAAAGLTGLVYKAGQFAAASVNLEAKFSQTMSLIGAATKAPAAELDGLSKLALKLGADTSFSANEAADAMLELAKSGLTTKQIMGGGVQATLQLAAAGGTELGTAATIASNAMNAFNVAGRDAKSVAAALAGGANASSASVESLGQALSQVGPGAVNAGLSLQETVAALSAFDAAGIKGSDAGTSLKTMLANLVPQSAKADAVMDSLGLSFVKANGEFVSLENVAGQLQKGLGGLSAAQRTTALNTLFGSDASRAATVLMREGTDGIRKFIKATNDQGAAQEMAEARMSGTAGTLERLSGAVETAQLRLGQELAPVVEKVGTGLADNVVPAMDAVIGGAKKLGDAVAPAVREITEALGDLIPSADQAGSAFNNQLIPAVSGLAEIVGGVVGLINDLPGPVKEIGIQAGIAALVLPRLAGGLSTVATRAQNATIYTRVLAAELRDSNTRSAALAGGFRKLGGAASTAAGVGGMVALAQGAQETSRGLRTLELTAGGALAGSAGGPWGALLGGALGLGMAVLSNKTDQASASFTNARQPAESFADSLDKISGAATQTTRELVYLDLQQRGAFESAAALGLSQRQLVNYVLGSKGAIEKVTTAIQNSKTVSAGGFVNGRYYAGQVQLTEGARDLAAALGISTSQLARDQAAAQQLSVATGKLGRSLGDLKGKAKIVARIESNGSFPETSRQVAQLTRGLKLTPKQIRTVIAATGAKASVADVQRVLATLKNADRTKANPKVTVETRRAQADIRGFLTSLTGDLGKAKSNATRGGREVQQGVEKGPKQARADLGPFNTGLASGLGRARTASASGGRSIGSAMSSGVAAGVSAAPIIGAMVAAVAAGIAAAKARAKIKSPSRVMRDEVGVMLGRGLVIGVNSQNARAKKSGQSLMDSLLRGVTGGRDKVEATLDRITRNIEQTLNRRLSDKKADARIKTVLKSLKDEYAALTANGKAQDKIQAKLEKARETYKSLVKESRDYAAGIKGSVVSFGNVVGLGVGEDDQGPTAEGILSQLRDRVRDAGKFAILIQQLRDRGLNETTLRQLLDAGVDGGLATAQAIAGAGSAYIDQINDYTGRLGLVGGALGDNMANTFYGAGIQAADGLVKGLQAKERELDRIAERLATALIRKVKQALGIKSPSRVFRDIGTQSVRGLVEGLDEAYVREAAAGLASAMTGGFGAPTLAHRIEADAAAAAQKPGADWQTQLLAQVTSLHDDLDAVARAAGVIGPTRFAEALDGLGARVAGRL